MIDLDADLKTIKTEVKREFIRQKKEELEMIN